MDPNTIYGTWVQVSILRFEIFECVVYFTDVGKEDADRYRNDAEYSQRKSYVRL